MNRHAPYILIAIFTLLLIKPAPMATAEQNRTEGAFDTFTFYIENDYFAGTDYGYTGGIKMTWSTPFKFNRTDYHLPKWADPLVGRLPFINDPDKENAVSFSIAQIVYTPESIDSKKLIEDDRPYAGINYFAAGIHSKTAWQKYSMVLEAGIIGPHSYAENFQNWGHEVTGSDRPGGWDNQLEDEFLLQTIFAVRHRLAYGDFDRSFSYDMIPHLGGRLGNREVSLNTGVEIRFGWNLPMNFGTCPIHTGCETNSAFYGNDRKGFDLSETALHGIHFFMSADGRLVIHDITLDGNTFRKSHSVDKEMLVADIMAGFAYNRRNFKLTYSYIYRTKQFKTQDYDTIFGALSFIIFF